MTNTEISFLFKKIAAAYLVSDPNKFRFQIIFTRLIFEEIIHPDLIGLLPKQFPKKIVPDVRFCKPLFVKYNSAVDDLVSAKWQSGSEMAHNSLYLGKGNFPSQSPTFIVIRK